MVHTPGSHLLTTNRTQIISKTRTHRSQQSILLQLFFATQCYTSGSEIWDLHAKLGLFWDQIWTLVPFGTKSQIWDFIIAPAEDAPFTVTTDVPRPVISEKVVEQAVPCTLLFAYLNLRFNNAIVNRS